MKRLSNKIFYIIILGLISISFIFALVIRNSIHVFHYEDIAAISSNLRYYAFEELMYSNGSFDEVTNTYDVIETSNYIIVGKATGKHKVLDGAIQTEIEVLSIYKGMIDSKYIEIYEPIKIFTDAHYDSISSYDGYNMIQDDREYIFCLQDVLEGIYMYSTPRYAKFPVDFIDSDFSIVSTDNKIYYKDYLGYEQLFQSKNDYDTYKKMYDKLKKLILP